MRRIEVRLTGKSWADQEFHLCHAVQITSNGDLVVMGVGDKALGETPDGQVVYGTKLQHGYSAGAWAEFRDAGEVEGPKVGEAVN